MRLPRVHGPEWCPICMIPMGRVGRGNPPGGTARRDHETHLHAVLTEYQQPYNIARLHQGNRTAGPRRIRDTTCATVTDFDTAPIHRRSVLGGLVNE